MLHAAVTFLGALLLVSTQATAQNFPSRPITLMVGLSPGGITDTVARTYSNTLAKKSGWTIVVENRTGAGGGVAATHVQNAAPDGHTLLLFSGSQHATVAAVTPGMYQSVEGFSPISLLFDLMTIIVVPAKGSANSLQQLFDLGRTKPGGLLMATQGVGSPPHILGSKLTAAAKVPVQPVHYRGGSALMTDLIEARVDFAFASVASGGAFVKDGKLKALAIDADSRSRIMPDVPTLAELGYGNQKIANWFGVAAPAGTSPQIIEALRNGFIKTSQVEELQQKLSELATPVVTSTPEQMRRLWSKRKSPWRNSCVFSKFAIDLPKSTREHLVQGEQSRESGIAVRRTASLRSPMPTSLRLARRRGHGASGAFAHPTNQK
jgi:tripartite-type tricarboxylate transporter receptor subunit TctC